MIRLLLVGDGERDAATVPHLVTTILGAKIAPETRMWVRLHGAGKGYKKKLLFALRQARDLRADGLVATVDSDKEKKGRRLRTLRAGRASDREKHPPLPTALGEAVPHGEAWILDDAAAVRAALTVPTDTEIPTLRETGNPKKTLHDLLRQSPRAGERPVEVWADIAKRLDPARCTHAKESGFRAFVSDVRSELGPLTPQASQQ